MPPTTPYLFQITFFAILTSAFSFVGAFVIRDFFKTSIEGLSRRIGLPESVANVFYVGLVLAIVVPVLVFIAWWKTLAETEEEKRKKKMLSAKK